jgi:hypothetical protein
LADAWVAALALFTTQINLLSTEVNGESSICQTAQASAAIALAAANFKGKWSDMVGAANIPYSVWHLNRYWMLVSNLANVTTKTPGTDAEWQLIPLDTPWLIKTGAYNAVSGDRIMANTTSAGFTITFPGSPAASDRIVVSDYAGKFDVNNCTIGRNGNKIVGLAEDFVCNTKNATFKFEYIDVTQGWRVV